MGARRTRWPVGAGTQDRTREARTPGAPCEAAATTNEDALLYRAPYYNEPDRGLIEAYDNTFKVASWEPWLTYNGIRMGDRLRKPTLAVHSEAAVIPGRARHVLSGWEITRA